MSLSLSELEGVTLEAAIEDLSVLLGNLNEKDKNFAKSLLAFHKKAGKLTFKQIPYIYQLLERAAFPGVNEHRKKIGDMKAITDLFLKAKEKLKFPVILLNLGGHQIKLRLQGGAAKFPGAVAVLVDKVWVGRVHTNGEFEMAGSFYQCAVQDEVIDTLVQFAKDPAGTAQKLGKLSCRCVFCNLPLTDEKSLAVGYGETCAGHWGLPYGDKKLKIGDLVEISGFAQGGPIKSGSYYVVGETHGG